MLVCRLNPQHVYPENYSQCPWCKQQEVPLNFPPPTQPAVDLDPLGPAPAENPAPPPLGATMAAPAAPTEATTPTPPTTLEDTLATPVAPTEATTPTPPTTLEDTLATPVAPTEAMQPPAATRPAPTRGPGKKRSLTGAIIATATLAAVASGLGVWFLTGRSTPEPQGAAAPASSSSPTAGETTPASPGASVTATPASTPSPSRTNLHLPEAPSAQLQAGAESRYSESYAAQVTGVSQDGLRLNVDFTATGLTDLRRPETSCLRIAGDDGQSYTARPAGLSLTTDATGHFEGTLTFPALISGKYSFLYSCRTDYSGAEIGTVTVPSVGVSRFSEDYYAVVLGYDYTDLFFAAHGRSDLRAPETSCITANAGTYNPEVTIESQWSPADKTLVGKMRFIREPKGSTFQYSCSGYTEVWVD